ncbi:MAG TPA: hypothetical protein VND41_00580 [Nitrososphaerales archaeon]|nr:hypothetical protein [Nitrososphaerales archaeon]
MTDAAGVTVTSNAVSVAVAKAPPTISTTVSNSGTITIGGSATDKATLSGAFTPTGSITYSVFTNSGCTTAVPTGSAAGQYTPNVVSANGANDAQTTSTAFTPASAGSYYWNAAYSGDSNNKAATSSCEALTVTAASPTITTTVAPSSVTLGTTAPTLRDTATLSGGYHETGTITFTLYHASTCGGTAVDTETVSAVSGDGAYSTPTGYTLPTSGTVTGTYEWVASYGGDTNNNLASTTCGAESATVSNASPSIGTTVSNSGTMTIGGSATDQGTFSNAYGTLTGTLVFSAYTSSSCSGGLSFTSSSIAVSGDGPYTSSSFPPSAPGAYYWQATFTDTDGNNNGFTTACGGSGETLDVQQAQPSISTAVMPASTNALGTSTYDTASIGNQVSGFTPSGTVTYDFYASASCSGTPTATAVTLNGDGSVPNSASQILAAGSYSYSASYGGDSNYLSATGACEPFTVQKGTATISTTVNPSTTPALGASVSDVATASGVSAFTPTGTVTITLYESNSCTGTLISTQTNVALDASSTAKTTLAAGSYSYQASVYSGDTNYLSGTSGACEPFTVSKASTTVTTTIEPGTSNALGTTTFDTATIGGTVTGFTPTGTVTYTFYSASGSCTGASTTQTMPLNPDGTVPSSSPQTLGAGSYSYTADYSGDSNYYASPTGACELLTVTKATATISTTLNAGTNPILGAAVSDSASATGVTGFPPTGTVTITLYAGGSCTGAAIDTSSGVSLGSPSPTVMPNLASGPYSFEASAYSGDDNYVSGTIGSCEPFTVQTPAQSTSSLISLVNSMNLPSGTTTSLVSKLSAALSSINSGNDNAAVNQLNAFINEVNAQTGKAITQSQAQTLTYDAQAIITALS